MGASWALFYFNLFYFNLLFSVVRFEASPHLLPTSVAMINRDAE